MTAKWRPRADTENRPVLAALGVLLAVATSPFGSAEGGVNVWTSHGPDGGSVFPLAVMPGNPTRLLAGMASGARTPSGGLWASTDAAASWHQIVALGDFNEVHALAFDPSNPAVAYLATSRTGIMRSRDGGDHWSSVGAVAAEAIAVAPSKPTTIYAVDTDGSILKSEDGAATWGSVTSGLPTGTSVASVAVQPESDLTVYAGTAGNGVFKSTDGGATWAAANAGLPDGKSVRISLLTFDLHSPANLVAVVWDTSSNQGGLYRSADGGTSWAVIFPYSGFTALSVLALGPRNPSLIYLAAGQTVFKSSDDGASWATFGVQTPLNVGVGTLAVDPNDTDVVYAGVGGGAGVLKSADGGATWTPSGHGLTATSLGALALDPGPGTALYALATSNHNETEVFSSPDHGANWASLGEIPLCFFPNTIVVDPSNPNTLYVGGRGNGAFKSTDGGRSWVGINQGVRNGVLAVYALAIDPSNPRTLYAGSTRFYDWGAFSGNVLYKTTNAGAAWEVMSSGLPTNSATVNALAVDPRNPATVYAGGVGPAAGHPFGQSFWMSTNGGRSWAAVSSVGEEVSSVSAIAIDPRNSDTVFCTTGSVYKSTDGWTTWTHSSPPGGAGKLALDPVRPAVLYVGGNGGVSMSQDGGTTWTLINGGLTNVLVTALVIDQTGTMLHAATDGGGVFDLELSTATPKISVSPTAVAIAAGGSTVLTATIGPPQLTDTRLTASSSNPEVASVLDVVTLAAGDTSVSFTVTGATAGATVISLRLPDSLGGASAIANVTVATRAEHVLRKHLRGTGP